MLRQQSDCLLLSPAGCACVWPCCIDVRSVRKRMRRGRSFCVGVCKKTLASRTINARVSPGLTPKVQEKVKRVGKGQCRNQMEDSKVSDHFHVHFAPERICGTGCARLAAAGPRCRVQMQAPQIRLNRHHDIDLEWCCCWISIFPVSAEHLRSCTATRL